MKGVWENRRLRAVSAILAATLTVVVILGVQFYISEEHDEEDCRKLVDRDLQIASMRIDAYLKDAERSIENLDEVIESQLACPDSIFGVMRHVVHKNPLILGCSLGFVSNYYPEKGHWFEPSAYRDGDSIVYEQVGSSHHDYFNMEWYQAGLDSQGRTGKWTAPYRDNSQNDRLMMSYCRQVKHGRRIVGVVSLDVSLEWITQMLRQVEPYRGSVCQLLSKDGEVIVSSDSLQQPTERHYFISHQIIGQRDLALLLACPKMAVYGDTTQLNLIMFGMLVMAALLLTYIVRRSVKSINRLHETQYQQEMVEGDLRIARSIQMGMLPKRFPPYSDCDEVNICGLLKPAKAVGGDLYDFYIRDQKLFFCIGDVSGKGIPASLVMAVTRALFRTISAHEEKPERIVSLLNESASKDNETNMFATLFVGVMDLQTGYMTYCNAGHDAPLLISKDGSRQGLLPVDSNLPAGVMPGWAFTSQETVIDSGATIFLYTDGLTEAENIDHEQFGDERLLDTARRICAKGNHSPQVLVEQMVDAVHQFVGDAEQSDDLTMMAIQYTPKAVENGQRNHSITLPNDIDTVPQLPQFIDEVAVDAGLDASQTMNLNLAIEEAVVNVMEYAYPEGTKGTVNIVATIAEGVLSFVISDSGMPFDPTIKAEVDTTLSAEERPIGGLGIHLVRQIMDDIAYERKDNKNILTLRKELK